MEKKIILGLFVLLGIFLIANPVMAYEFSHDYVEDNLGFFDKMSIRSGQTFTIAGQERICDIQPRNSGTFTGERSVSGSECSDGVGLINWYQVNGDDWTYIREDETPSSFKGSSSQTYAFEMYCCPKVDEDCIDGERSCVTESTYQVCENGDWKKYRCPHAYQTCSRGKCKGEEHMAGAECIVTGKRVGWEGGIGYTECIEGKVKWYQCPDETAFSVVKQGCVEVEIDVQGNPIGLSATQIALCAVLGPIMGPACLGLGLGGAEITGETSNCDPVCEPGEYCARASYNPFTEKSSKFYCKSICKDGQKYDVTSGECKDTITETISDALGGLFWWIIVIVIFLAILAWAGILGKKPQSTVISLGGAVGSGAKKAGGWIGKRMKQ